VGIIAITHTRADYYKAIEDNPKEFLDRRSYFEYRLITERYYQILNLKKNREEVEIPIKTEELW